MLCARNLSVATSTDNSPLAGPIALDLHEGDCATITGSSGSGKSTLLRCLAMLEAQAVGSISFRDQRISGDAVPAFRRQVIYVSQSPPRFSMSVRQSLQRAMQFSGCKSHYDEGRAEKLFDDLLLDRELLRRPLPQVSGGEAQRIALVRALLLEPSILLLDEVDSALDEQSAGRVRDVLQRWLEGPHRAGIAVTHKASPWGKRTNRRLQLFAGTTLSEREAI